MRFNLKFLGTILFAVTFLVGGFLVANSAQATSVTNLQPSWTANGGGGVWASYQGPTDYAYVSPGVTTTIDGRVAAPISAGLTIDPTDNVFEDQGLLGFKPGEVPVASFATQQLTYDFENQSGVNPVWVYIELNKGVAGDMMYQYVPATNPTGWHTEDAATGAHWLAWTEPGSGITTGSPVSLADIAAANPGKTVSRVYLNEGMGDSYNNGGTGTVAWVSQVTIGGTTYNFVLAPIPTAPSLTSASITSNGSSIGDLTGVTLATTDSGSCDGTNGGTTACRTLNVSGVTTANGNLSVEDAPFTMQATGAQSLLAAYFAAQTGWTDPMKAQIASEIAGTSPFFYFVSDGAGTYSLADGFKWGLGATNQPLVIDDNYPAGIYTFIGTVAGVSKTVTLTVTKPVVKTNQTITFNPLADRIYGEADFTVNASVTSGLSVDFSASGACWSANKSGNTATVHLTGAGTCTITATQGGNSNYNAAPTVSRMFTVTGVDTIAPTATVVQSGQTITYTFSEPMQLTNNDGSAIAGTIAEKLAVYQVTGLDYTTASLVPGIIITDATLVDNVLTITYTGTLVAQTNVKYVVDAWGYKISDLAGNKLVSDDSQMFTVTGVDTIAPTATVTYNVTTPTNGSVIATITPSETVVGDLTHTFTANETYTFSFTDLAGNSGSVVATVANIDTTAPVITVTGTNPVTVAQGSTYTDEGATATDNVDATVTVNSSGTVNTNTVGVYTITYSATDAAGNVATLVTRTVNVVKTNHGSSGGSSRATPAVPAKKTIPEGCEAGNKFSPTTGRNCNAATPAVPARRVLGASTQVGQVLGAEKFVFTLFMKNGSKGNEVIELQKFLNALGETLVVDGKFGPKTKTAVIKFQLANGLKGDGVVGPLTRVFLNK